MASGLPDEVKKTITGLESAVNEVEKHIESYLKTSVDEITAQLSAEDAARLSVLLAYALNSLYYSKSSSPVYYLNLFFSYLKYI